MEGGVELLELLIRVSVSLANVTDQKGHLRNTVSDNEKIEKQKKTIINKNYKQKSI